MHRALAARTAGDNMLGVTDDASLRAALLRHWEYAASDQDITHEIYAEDAVLEFPQSGERFEGVANFREWRRIYPADLKFWIRRISGSGASWVAENALSYDGEPEKLAVNVLAFRGEKVIRERIFIMDRWPAADWRAPWRAASGADDELAPYPHASTVDEQGLRSLYTRYWELAGSDADAAHRIYHDAAVVEFPQSGERFEGVPNFREWRRVYPAQVKLELERLSGGDPWVMEGFISYDGGKQKRCVSLVELHGTRVIRERNYVMEPWPAAEWRAPWRSSSNADD
jgi:hypothetical protein